MAAAWAMADGNEAPQRVWRMATARNTDAQALDLEFVPQPVGIVALVAEQRLGGRGLRQEHQGPSGIAHLTKGQKEGQRATLAVADHVQLRGQSVRRAPDRPRAEPPFLKLAAVRCAFRCVLSIMIVWPHPGQAWSGHERCVQTPPGGTTGQGGYSMSCAAHRRSERPASASRCARRTGHRSTPSDRPRAACPRSFGTCGLSRSLCSALNQSCPLMLPSELGSHE
jgi:hypothetical protein